MGFSSSPSGAESSAAIESPPRRGRRGIPACTGLGPHCRELAVTLSIADLEEDDAASRDHLATWLLGHTERLTFGAPYVRGRRVLVDAVIHVACRYLEEATGDGRRSRPRSANGETPAGQLSEQAEPKGARCRAHGFVGPWPPGSQPAIPASPQHADGTVTVVYRGRLRRRALEVRAQPQRRLPVVERDNPCRGAPCRTADHRRGAACCRDLTLEVLAPAHDPASDHLEALLLARRSPYLCKTGRVSHAIIECEVISACGYLAGDGITCVLHDRIRPDGKSAKPFVCSKWPDLGPDGVGHPGCRLLPPGVRAGSGG